MTSPGNTSQAEPLASEGQLCPHFWSLGVQRSRCSVGSVDFINPQPPVARSKTSWELGGFDAVDFGMRRKHSKLWISIFTLP